MAGFAGGDYLGGERSHHGHVQRLRRPRADGSGGADDRCGEYGDLGVAC
jgi:hypothetical protein